MAGRPTTYDPDYCQQLIDHMAAGYSFESFAGLIKVARSTIYEWADTVPEFSDAKKAAFEASRLWWEKQGIEGLYTTTEYDEEGRATKNKSINATLWIFNMKNRFRDEWKDKTETDLSAKVQINKPSWFDGAGIETKSAT